MDLDFVPINASEFNAEIYLRVLISIVKADRFNGRPERDYVRNRAHMLGLDFEELWETTEKGFSIQDAKVARPIALVILKDCVALASLDSSYTLFERSLVYGYAEKLDVSRSDVEKLEEWVEEYQTLNKKWDKLVAGKLSLPDVPLHEILVHAGL